MALTTKVTKSPNVCKVALYTNGIPEASVAGDRSFYNISEMHADPSDFYTTPGTISISETSSESRAGTIYTQKITFALPTSDALRAQRIDQFHKVKFLEVTLTNGAKLIMGRNDIFQNAKPKVGTKSDEKLTQVEFSCRSIAPLPFKMQVNLLYQDDIIFIFQDGTEFVT